MKELERGNDGADEDRWRSVTVVRRRGRERTARARRLQELCVHGV